MGVVGVGNQCTRHHPPGPKLLAPHPAKEAPCGEVAVHELVPLLVEETDAGMYGPAGSEKTFVLKVMGALPLGHVFVMYSLKPVRRGGMMNSRPLARRCHSCVPEKCFLSQI